MKKLWALGHFSLEFCLETRNHLWKFLSPAGSMKRREIFQARTWSSAFRGPGEDSFILLSCWCMRLIKLLGWEYKIKYSILQRILLIEIRWKYLIEKIFLFPPRFLSLSYSRSVNLSRQYPTGRGEKRKTCLRWRVIVLFFRIFQSDEAREIECSYTTKRKMKFIIHLQQWLSGRHQDEKFPLAWWSLYRETILPMLFSESRFSQISGI